MVIGPLLVPGPRVAHCGDAAGFAALLSLACLVGCLSISDPGNLVPPTADQDPHLPQIDLVVAGHTRAVHVESRGDPGNPTILVLHGSLGDFRALRPFMEFADRYHVVMWDQRGNGLSERITAAEYSETSIVEEIDAMRERFSPDGPVILIGHSFGAMYAALYISRHPEHVSGAILMEPGGLTGEIFSETFSDIVDISLFDPGLNQMFWQNELLSPSDHEAMDYRALMMLLNTRQTRYHCDPDHPVPFPVWRPGAHVEVLRGRLLGASGGTSPVFTHDFTTGLDVFGGEVLFLSGECSALGPAYQERWHLPLFRSSEQVGIENAGHRLFVEQWEVVREAVRDWLPAYRDETGP